LAAQEVPAEQEVPAPRKRASRARAAQRPNGSKPAMLEVALDPAVADEASTETTPKASPLDEDGLAA
jgi:hypothetical protein